MKGGEGAGLPADLGKPLVPLPWPAADLKSLSGGWEGQHVYETRSWAEVPTGLPTGYVMPLASL